MTVRASIVNERGTAVAVSDESRRVLSQADVNVNDYDPAGNPWINQTNKLRITGVESRFEGRFFYGLNKELWQAAANVNGSRVYMPFDNGVDLQVAGSAGDKYYDITKTLFFYQSDAVITAASAFAFTLDSNIIQFWGIVSYQNNEIKDGYVLRMNQGRLEFVKYSSSIDGIPRQTILPRYAWTDPMDGSGRSGINLNFNDLQMVEIEHAWYGGGTAALKFRLNKKTYTAASFTGANSGTKKPIIANPVLSVMYGLEAVNDLSAPASFERYGLSVSSDGDNTPTGKPYAVLSDQQNATGGQWTPVLSIRLKQNFSIDGAALKPNVYGYITDLILSIQLDGREGQIAFIRDAVLTGDTAFIDIPDLAGNPVTDSMVEYNDTASGISGGQFFQVKVLERNVARDFVVAQQDTIALDSLGTASTILTIAARPNEGGNAQTTASFSWREVY